MREEEFLFFAKMIEVPEAFIRFSMRRQLKSGGIICIVDYVVLSAVNVYFCTNINLLGCCSFVAYGI